MASVNRSQRDPQAAPSAVNFPNGSYGNFISRDTSPPSTTALNGALPNSAYTFRAPSPPHIHIPQATEDHMFALNAPTDIGYTKQDDIILGYVTAAQTSMIESMDWQYEFRRRAQQILSFMYLGPSSSARDAEALSKAGITMLLVIRNTMTAQASLLSGEKMARQLGIESAAVDVAGNQELIAAFPRAVDIINDHLIRSYRRLAKPDDARAGRNAWGKVLIFCESGNERSAAVVAAYLMKTFALDIVKALQYIQAKRFCVAYDDGLKNLLQAYDDILGAQRAVSRGNSTTPQPIIWKVPKRQRAMDDDDDDDMHMDGGTKADDIERFDGRTSFAPFHDAS